MSTAPLHDAPHSDSARPLPRSRNRLAAGLFALALLVPSRTQAAPAELRILLITGGCCHDYAHQKEILKKGLESRLHAVVDQVHTSDGSTRPPLPILGNPDYAKGYDVVIHDECAADISDPQVVEAVLKPHRDGVPGVNLHCAMHSYRIGNPGAPATNGTPHAFWFEYLGIQSSGHGPQEPISIHFTDSKHPITKGLGDWTTIKEELYNNVHVFDSAGVLAQGSQVVSGRQGASRTNSYSVVWLNQYGPNKTRVFSTTIGHNNETVADARYLDLVARGVLWAVGHLKDDGTPEEGYGAESK